MFLLDMLNPVVILVPAAVIAGIIIFGLIAIIVAIVKNAVLASGPRPDGIEPKIQENEDPNLTYYYHRVNNTVVLGADIANINDSFGYRKNEPACYSNVYTDGIGADGRTGKVVAHRNGEGQRPLHCTVQGYN